MTNWITATGDVEASASTIADKSITSQIKTEVGNGGGWQSAGDGKAVNNPSTSYQARANDDESGGVMATVRSPQGSTIMSRRPNGNDIIKYRGMDTDARRRPRRGSPAQTRSGGSRKRKSNDYTSPHRLRLWGDFFRPSALCDRPRPRRSQRQGRLKGR